MPDRESRFSQGVVPACSDDEVPTRCAVIDGAVPYDSMASAAAGSTGLAELRTFHNRDVPPRYRFEAFRRFYASLGDPSRYMPYGISPEHFSAEATLLTGISTSVHQSAHSPLRTVFAGYNGAAHGGSPRVWMAGGVSGSGVLAVRGHVQRFRPFSMCLMCSDEPFVGTFDKPSSFVAVEVPRERLSLNEADLRRISFSMLPARRLMVTLFLPAVRALLDPNGTGLDRAGLDQCIVGLTELIVRTADGLEPDHSDTHGARRLQIEQYVREHLAEPGLCAHSVATEFQISVRLVHKLFQGQPETLHDLIQRQRVEHAERLLAAHPELRLDRISEKTGFGSTKTLMRAFRRVYGQTPYQHFRGLPEYGAPADSDSVNT